MATGLERRWRDALLASILPAPGRGLPAIDELDLEPFWPRFQASAPLHLRLGFRLATVAIAVVLPWLAGYRATLAGLDGDRRDAVVERAGRLRGFAELLEVAKVVASFAYFSDAAVIATAKERR